MSRSKHLPSSPRSGLVLTVSLLLLSVCCASFSSSSRSIRGATTRTTTRTHLELSSSELPLRVLQPNNINNKNDVEQGDDWDDDDAVPTIDPVNPNNKDNNKNNKQVFPDDVYHCDDPEVIDDEFDKDKTVICDWDTHEWDLTALHPDKIPKHCKDLDWVFEGDVQGLQDWEEPCYLWSLLYGNLNATAPTGQPTTLHPTVAPSTQEPTAEPTLAVTQAPTEAPTEPQDEDEYPPDTQETNRPSLTPTDPTPTMAPTSPNYGPKTYDISTMVMTFLINPQPKKRRLLSNYPTRFDRQILQEETARHVQRELKRALTFWLEQQKLETAEPLQVGVDLTLTSVRSDLLANETMVATEALSGSIRVHGPQVEWPETIEPHVDNAFHGAALNRFIDLLRQSQDPILRQTESIEIGLPLDLLGGVSSNANPSVSAVSGRQNETIWSIGGINFTLTTLAIIAASIAVFSILLLMCVCWKLRNIRKQHYLDRQEATTKPSHSTDDSSQGAGKTPSKKSRLSFSAKTSKTKDSKKPVETSPNGSEYIDESDPKNHKYYQRYVPEADDRSYATSTYSYLDANLHRDGGISLAPSYFYANDDASLQSKTMWSLIDGINNDDNYNYDQTASPGNPNAKNPSASTPTKLISPSNMMITTASKAPYDDSTAGGDDDNISLTSLGIGRSFRDHIQLAKTGGILPVRSKKFSPDQKADDKEEEEPLPTSSVDLPAVTTPTQADRPFHEEKKEDEAPRTCGRLGVSARKKKSSLASTSGRLSSDTPSSVRKAFGHLTGCTTSAQDSHGDLLPMPSGDVISPYASAASRSRKAKDSTIKDINKQLAEMGDSALNSKNSSILPDKLFQDDSLETTKVSVINSGHLSKNKNGDYIIDSMSSF